MYRPCRGPECTEEVLGNSGYCSPYCRKVVALLEDASNPLNSAKDVMQVIDESNYSYEKPEGLQKNAEGGS